MDESLDNGSVAPADQNQPAELPATLAGALAAFERLVKVERARLESIEQDPDAAYDAGVAYAIAQCRDLIANGVDGLHFYTLNKSKATVQICQGL